MASNVMCHSELVIACVFYISEILHSFLTISGLVQIASRIIVPHGVHFNECV